MDPDIHIYALHKRQTDTGLVIIMINMISLTL
jgi:hypothetical protein